MAPLPSPEGGRCGTPAGQPGTDKQLELTVDHDRDHDEMLRRSLLGVTLGDMPPSRLCGRWCRLPETVACGLCGRGVDAVASSFIAFFSACRDGKLACRSWLP